MKHLLAFSMLVSLAAAGCGGGQTSSGENSVAALGGQVAGVTMTAARADQSAGPLPDGKVLVVGGTSNDRVNGMLASAEIYDPSADRFSPTGSMSVTREGQTQTLLPNGKVLIAGGIENFGFRETLRSAELYDPASGTFTRTSDMKHEREGHAATLLRNGNVLLTGGRDNSQLSLNSAELYDPASGTFRPTGHLKYAREAHTATLLDSGKVLVAGGGYSNIPGGYVALYNCELYDPAAGAFSVTGRLAHERFGHTATLLRNGQVLIAGGHSGQITGLGPSVPSVFFTGMTSAELYDPEAGGFQKTGSLLTAHYLHTATMLTNGRVLIAGGWNSVGPAPVGIRDAEIYDPVARQFVAVAPLLLPRLDQTATLLPNGWVLIAGGIDGNANVTASCEFYDPAAQSFKPKNGGGSTASLPPTKGQ